MTLSEALLKNHPFYGDDELVRLLVRQLVRRHPHINRISVRGGSGFGDALYVQAVARHLVRYGQKVEACSNYPDVFWPLRGCCTASGFRRNATIIAHYSLRRQVLSTDQFQDCCIQAGLAGAVELRLDWEPRSLVLVGAILAAARGRPIVVALLPRKPMARTDGVFDVLLPDCRVLQMVIDRARMRGAFVVQVGAGEPLFKFRGIDLDLANRTKSVSDVIDVVYVADACVGYVSFMVPLAESLNKPMLSVWSRRGLEASNPLVARLTPRKVIHKKDLVRTVVDDCPEAGLDMAGL